MAGSIAVLGAGAVGGTLGVLLAKAGHDVTVVASDRTCTAINVDGLTLRSVRYGQLHARVPARPWLTAPVDVLFVTVKATRPARGTDPDTGIAPAELDAIAGPVLRAAPDGAPVTRGVVAEIIRSAAR